MNISKTITELIKKRSDCLYSISMPTKCILLVLMVFSATRCSNWQKDDEISARSDHPIKETEQVRDVDGNVYHAMAIGNHVWFAENLKTTHYRNGEPVLEIQNESVWRKMTQGAMCNYDNDNANTAAYGRLYNWYAVKDSRNICPEGWHIPSDQEWYELVSFLGGEMTAGGKLKESAPGHWLIPNTGANNESGFSAVPGGYRSSKGVFQILDTYAFYWTSTSCADNMAWSWFLQNDSEGITRIENLKTFGFSIRCVKDK